MKPTGKQIRLSLIFFLAGMGLGNIIPIKLAQMASLFLLALSIAIWFVISGRWKHLAIVLLMLFALGLGRSSFTQKTLILPNQFEATVVADSVPTAYGNQTAMRFDGQNLKIYLPRYPEFQVGDLIKVKVKSTEKFIKGQAELIKHGQGNILVNGILDIKRQFIKGLSLSLPEPNASFVAGTVVGGTAGLSDEVKQAFRTTGISHILAASGYNFSLLILFVAFCLRQLSLRKQIFASLLVIPVFVVMAGGSSAVLRAALMSGLGGVAILSGRISSAKTALLWSAAILLVLQPRLLNFDLGFQLSFLATLGLALLVPLFERLYANLTGWREDLLDAVSTSLSAQILTWPIIAYSFGMISLAGLPMNLLIGFFIPPIMVLGILASASALVWPLLGKIVAIPVWLLSELVIKSAEKVSQLPWAAATVNFALLGMMGIYLLYVVVFFAIKYKTRHKLVTRVA